MVASPLVRLVMVCSWARLTESRVLGGTAGGILTWAGAAGGAEAAVAEAAVLSDIFLRTSKYLSSLIVKSLLSSFISS